MLCSSKPCFPLIEGFQVALSTLGLDIVSEETKNYSSLDLSPSENYGCGRLRVGEKRPAQAPEALKRKCQKIHEAFVECNSNFQDVNKLNYITSEGKREYADYMHSSLLFFVELLQPPGGKASSLGPDVALTALSMLCIVFFEYTHTNLSRCIFRQMREWILWICEQAKQGISITLEFSIFLEAVHSVLLTENACLHIGFLPVEDKLFRSESSGAEFMHFVLKLPWTNSLVISEPHLQWKAKCLSLQALSKIVRMSESGSNLDVLDLGLHDEAEVVRMEAVIAMPVIVLYSSSGMLTHILKRMV